MIARRSRGTIVHGDRGSLGIELRMTLDPSRWYGGTGVSDNVSGVLPFKRCLLDLVLGHQIAEPAKCIGLHEGNRSMTQKTDSEELPDRLLHEGIKPHVEAIAEIMAAGEIAVAVCEQLDDAREVARELGQRADEPVFQMSNAGRKRLIDEFRHRNPVTVNWRRRMPRIAPRLARSGRLKRGGRAAFSLSVVPAHWA